MKIFAPLLACFLVACATSTVPNGDGDGDGDIDASIGTDGQQLSCSNDPCDIYDQCGCASPQVCDLNFTTLDGATACRDVNSPGTETSACGNFDSEACAGGYICLGGGGSQCRKYCETDVDCGGQSRCLIEPSANGGPIPGVKVCTKSCDPASANPAGCPSTFGCGVFTIGAEAVADCTPANAAGTNEVSCADGAAGDPCAAGHTCIIFTINGVEDRRVCKQTCSFPGGTCGTGTCQQLGSMPTVGGVEYGFCN